MTTELHSAVSAREGTAFAPAPQTRPARRAADLVPPSMRLAKRAVQSWLSGEPELRLLPSLCRPDALMLDIGANYGVYAWHGARHASAVVAFEPQPHVAAFLRKALGRRARVEQVALSNAEGEAVLRAPLERMLDGCATIESENDLGAQPANAVRVPCRRLDGYRLDRVGMVKIDVEGHELAVIEGAAALLARDRPALIVEAEERHRKGAVESVAERLESLGYRGHFLRAGRLYAIASLAGAMSVGERAAQQKIFNFVFLPDTDLHPQINAVLA